MTSVYIQLNVINLVHVLKCSKWLSEKTVNDTCRYIRTHTGLKTYNYDKHGKGLSEDSHDSASMDMMDILKHIPEIKFIYVMYMVNNSMNSVCL